MRRLWWSYFSNQSELGRPCSCRSCLLKQQQPKKKKHLELVWHTPTCHLKDTHIHGGLNISREQWDGAAKWGGLVTLSGDVWGFSQVDAEPQGASGWGRGEKLEETGRRKMKRRVAAQQDNVRRSVFYSSVATGPGSGLVAREEEEEGGGGCQSRLEQEVWDPESWGSHVRMWPSSALPWQASAPSALPAGRPPFPATKTHMDTQRCTLSLPPSPLSSWRMCSGGRARTLPHGDDAREGTVKDERKADEFVDCAV